MGPMILENDQNTIEGFEALMNEMWVQGLQSDIVQEIQSSEAFLDKKLVAIYLTQVYHYAIHTPRHQALVGVNRHNQNLKFMQYCFEHALEETGHELMALKDIRSLGFDITAENMPPKLDSTKQLIDFLYEEAQSATPVHHLGYGFWSENACPFIETFMESLMQSMDLEKNQMTFYNSHSSIDVDHAYAVRKIIDEVVTLPEEWIGMKRVASKTFQLTLGILKESFLEYQRLNEGKRSDFVVLNNRI